MAKGTTTASKNKAPTAKGTARDSSGWESLREKTIREARAHFAKFAARKSRALGAVVDVRATENMLRRKFGTGPPPDETEKEREYRETLELGQQERSDSVALQRQGRVAIAKVREALGELAAVAATVRSFEERGDLIAGTPVEAAQLWELCEAAFAKAVQLDRPTPSWVGNGSSSRLSPTDMLIAEAGALDGRFRKAAQARPADLANMVILAGAVTDPEWKNWQAKGETPDDVLALLSKRLKSRASAMRQASRRVHRASKQKKVSPRSRPG